MQEALWGMIAEADVSIAYVFLGFHDDLYLDCESKPRSVSLPIV